MDILICTHKRRYKQLTFNCLPLILQNRVKFVIQATEVDKWKTVHPNNLVVLPPVVKDLPTTREYLQKHWTGGDGSNKIVMMDDDLVFSRRRYEEPTKFTANNTALQQMFGEIDRQLDNYAHVGVSHREGANRHTDEFLYVNRMMRVLAYRTDIVKAEGILSNRTPDVEDFDVTLQLLRKGYPNCIVNGWVHNQSGSDQSGGCSDYRTAATHDRDVRIFAAAHHPFVKVVKKKTKDNWCADENGERTDVTIYWKKAYAESGQTDLLDTGKVQDFNAQKDGRNRAVE